MYNITPNGPYFTSLFEVIEEARKSPIIQNHMFDIVLTSSPPKVNTHTYINRNACYAYLCLCE